MQEYQKIGLKCGLEVHQQLDTGKLFCRCQGILQEGKPDVIIERRLRPVVSELGEYDPAALEAYKKGLYYRYEAYNAVNCLICTDESPPKPAEPEALQTILTIALLTNSTILENVPVMRKLVIDGSNTSGFQRTALMAINGALEISSGKKIGIQAMALEEDAARPSQKSEDHITYRLDRLGIPLIELATEPDITTPAEAKQTALAIGNLFRRTCKAKRGLGTIRQDLNISIKDGARVEVKGVQELELIDEYVRREVQRQQKLLEIKHKLSDTNLQKTELEQPLIDCSAVFSNSDCKFLKGKNVLGVRLPKFFGIFGFEVQPNRRFGTEIAGLIKVKTGLKGILHSDELPGYGVSEKEVQAIKQKLGCAGMDAFVLVSGTKEKAENALLLALDRCHTALKGVPEETRQALEDGNTEYLRPLPGAARMYPETDLDSIEITPQQLAALKNRLPLSLEKRVLVYTKAGLSKQLAEKMKLDNWACFFEEQLSKKRNASFMAWILLEGLTQLKRQGKPVETLTPKHLEEFFAFHQKGKIIKENALEILSHWSQEPFSALETILTEKTGEMVSESEVEKIVEQIVAKNSKLVSERKMGAIGPLMGDVMKELRGKVSGEKASQLLKNAIQKKLSS
ncbi:Glu-tRNA(Gln) amidotransferase subunit GatE [Candidatus Micrarchaeota archaeon]|nr:Glu-tRNA(Gln) amidotransferase subunit GatE [Candidatus Micrarchaeota archaeon]